MGTGALMAAYGLATRSSFAEITAPMVLGVCLFSLGLFALRFNAETTPNSQDAGPAEYIPPPRSENRF